MSEKLETKLTATERARIESNRQKAMQLRRARLVTHPCAKIDTNVERPVIKIQGTKFVDSGGGFLVEEAITNDPSNKNDSHQEPTPVHEALIIPPTYEECLDCGDKFADSFLLNNFDYAVCDKCRDPDEKHTLITKTEAKEEYLLKDCDFDRREPILKFISKKNPHSRRGQMKLYLHLQVEKKAIDIWGSEEEIIKQREERIERREMSKIKRYSRGIKQLRMDVRSSLYTKPLYATHTHEFGPEKYNESDDNYTRSCLSCQYSETFEKM